MPQRPDSPTPDRPPADAALAGNPLFAKALAAMPSPSGAPDGMSRQELAEAVNAELARLGSNGFLTDKDIGRFWRGETRWPRDHYREALRTVLGVDTDRKLGFYRNRRTSARSTVATLPTPSAGAGGANDDADRTTVAIGAPRRTLLGGIATVAAACGLLGDQRRERRVGAGDVDRLSAITALYRSVDYECGGGMLYVEVSTFAESASALLDQTYPEPLAPRLLTAVAAARQLAGWTAFDSCRHSDAQRHFLAAERMAVAADDVLLAARVRYCQARQYQHLRHNRDALNTLRLARDHVGSKSTAAVGAMLDGALAASLAALGEGAHALAALGRAEDGFDKIDLDREPDWMHFYDSGELLAQYGRVYRDLARADRRHGDAAVQSTAKAIDAFGPQNTRSSLLNEVGLCSAWFLADEPEKAVTVGTRAIEQAQGLASPRVVDRLRNVRHDLTRHQTVPEATEFAHKLAALGTGAPR